MNLRNAASKSFTNVRNGYLRLATAATAVVLSGASALAAAAPPSVAQGAVTAIDGAKTDVGLVQTAIIGVLVLLVVFMFIKRSMGK